MNSNFWVKVSERMPDENGEYLVVVPTYYNEKCFIELCYYNSEDKSFNCWDWYNDCEIIYTQDMISHWLKIPEYKNLEK